MEHCFPGNGWASASWWEVVLMGSSEWIPCFALLAWVAFALLIKLSLSVLKTFLTFTLLILSPMLLGGVNEQQCGTAFLAGIKPQHHPMPSHNFHISHHLVSSLVCLSVSSRLWEWKRVSLSILQMFLDAFGDFHTVYFHRWDHYQNKKKSMSLLAFLGCFLSLALFFFFSSRKQEDPKTRLWVGWYISVQTFFLICLMRGQVGL